MQDLNIETKAENVYFAIEPTFFVGHYARKLVQQIFNESLHSSVILSNSKAGWVLQDHYESTTCKCDKMNLALLCSIY